MSAHPLRRPAELVEAGLVPPNRLAALEAVAARYAVALTPEVAALIDAANPDDPIARQFVPDPAELVVAPEERADPIGDDAFSPVPGIVHRYPDRVLLKPIHTCAVYCRYCFRRETVGQGDGALDDAALERALDYVRAHPAIWEVILSGGDPLILSPRRLRTIVAALDAIPHLGVIRLHTRVPIVDAARVTPALVAALAAEKAVYVVLHANHPRELTERVRLACDALRLAGIPLLAQSVLLAGVNDDPAILEALMRGLVALRVKPYYLHHPDLARGTGRFRLPLETGQALMRALRARASGLCQPSYVLDIPGGHGKVPVGPDYLRRGADGGWELRDPRGVCHRYPPAAGQEADDPSTGC
jgi:lysine 2,3-aminomutase